MSDVMPIGYSESVKDWNIAFARREHTLADWNTLTLGEQAQYAARECQTKGAIYTSTVSRNRIEFSILLPESLALVGLTKDEAEKLESHLHRVMANQIAAILQLRQYRDAFE